MVQIQQQQGKRLAHTPAEGLLDGLGDDAAGLSASEGIVHKEPDLSRGIVLACSMPGTVARLTPSPPRNNQVFTQDYP
jgi:hypothetical protein